MKARKALVGKKKIVRFNNGVSEVKGVLTPAKSSKSGRVIKPRRVFE